MNLKLSVVLIVFLCMGFMTSINNKKETPAVFTFENLEPLLNLQDDTIHVVNFWATWCKPCVLELPYFEQITKEYSNKPVKVTLVSLDFKSNWDTGLKRFLENKNIQSQVIILHETDANSWIPKVDSTWSGAIPATLVYHNDKRIFVEGEIDHAKLVDMIEKVK